MIRSKTLATRLAKECRRSLKAYPAFRSIGDVTEPLPGSGVFQFMIWGDSLRPREPGSGSIQSRAYVMVQPMLDVLVEHDQYFPDELLECIFRNTEGITISRVQS